MCSSDLLNNQRSTTQNYLVPMTSKWNCSYETEFVLPQYIVHREGVFSGYAFKGRNKFNIPIRNKEKFVTEIKKTEYIKNQISIPIEIWMAFLGIYLAEGWTSKEKQSRHNIYIAQSKKSKHWNEIKELLEKLPFNFKWQEKRQLFEVSNAVLWNYLKQFGHSHEKFVDEKVKDFPPRLLKIFLDWAIKGDGHVNSRGQRHYVTVSRKLADDIQEIMQKCGRDGYIKIVDQSFSIGREIRLGSIVKTSRVIYKIYERKGTHRSLLPPKKVNYIGQVYCVNVPNGIVYVRRNGHPLWCGNSEGNVPEGFVTVPRDIASSRDQLKAWQDAWDAMLSGDPRFQRKLKFMPEGMAYDPVVKPSDMTFERFEKWLLLNTCSVMGVAPTAIGFNFETNRSTAETSFEAGKERSLFPTASFVKELMDRFIQEDMGFEDLEFNWTNINPTNRAEEAKVVKDLINSGLMAIDEWRLGENLKPTGAKDPFIMTPVGPMFVKSLVKQMEEGQLPILPYKPPAQAAAASTNAGEGAMATPNVPQANTKTKVSSTEIIDELRRWRKAAVNDLKFDRNFRDFKSDIIDDRTQMVIKKNLQAVKTKEDIEKVFTPFISEEHKNVLSVINLYDEIDSIISNQPDQIALQSQTIAG